MPGWCGGLNWFENGFEEVWKCFFIVFHQNFIHIKHLFLLNNLSQSKPNFCLDKLFYINTFHGGFILFKKNCFFIRIIKLGYIRSSHYIKSFIFFQGFFLLFFY